MLPVWFTNYVIPFLQLNYVFIKVKYSKSFEQIYVYDNEI